MITEDKLASSLPAKQSRIQDLSDEVNENQNLLDVMIPYADLMTLLLVFFVFFYITMDYEKNRLIIDQNKQIVEQNERLMELARLDTLLEMNEQCVTIPGEVLFNAGEALLKWESLRTLAQVARNIHVKIKGEPGWQVRVEGHTDNLPILSSTYASNWELSTARALNVVKFFIDNNFFPPEQMQAMGYGEFKPLVPNETFSNRKKNNRVEIRLINSYRRD
ncbi:MAG: flagellar motor protein MotB [Candidatus Cloacimonetes bacterium]|nr:flagellar motor protein MotB [Candidatus Cloacimonadota bacterium]